MCGDHRQTWFVLIVMISSILSIRGSAQQSESEKEHSNDNMNLEIRYQVRVSKESDRFHRLSKPVSWDPNKTAIIVCDVWDSHHCLNAVRRVKQFAPRLNQVLNNARADGVTIIHSPSDCMPFYEKHPARVRALAIPKSKTAPQGIESWCSRIPSEERAVYPIDQSDGGEDDDPLEHGIWVKELERAGRNPGTPWLRQNELIKIHGDTDFISDRGDEVWNILEDREIQNVILTGVHTNMCVLGRPFGLRQMIRGKKNVVLMRDMTDTMYNPQRWPYVSHFSGTDLVIGHIERYVCPTITSDQLVGGKPFRFEKDRRPHVVILMAEQEYRTHLSLPRFAEQFLQKDFRISYVHDDPKNRNQLPGLEVVDDADLLLISVRRRLLEKSAMDRIRKFVADGKPVIGIRTASHAFALRQGTRPEGLVDWPEFDQQVFGGNYSGHHGNDEKTQIVFDSKTSSHAIMTSVDTASFESRGSLYKTSPLNSKTKILVSGKIPGHDSEPVAWTFIRADGGRSFYTSLGHTGDFEQSSFQRLLFNSVVWCLDQSVAKTLSRRQASIDERWVNTAIPHRWDPSKNPLLKNALQKDPSAKGWYRCLVRLKKEDRDKKIQLRIGHGVNAAVWINGETMNPTATGNVVTWFDLKDAKLDYGDLNLLVIRIDPTQQVKGNLGLISPPEFAIGDRTLRLQGNWQFRIGNERSFAKLALPPKFAASTDMIFE